MMTEAERAYLKAEIDGASAEGRAAILARLRAAERALHDAFMALPAGTMSAEDLEAADAAVCDAEDRTCYARACADQASHRERVASAVRA
jgi:chemotaxis regulatin CheY-phosphate phosphatase CheZ